MKLPLSILSFLAILSLSTSCSSPEKTIGVLNIDKIQLATNSAGMAYDVINETRLDSSNGLKYTVTLKVTNKGNRVLSFKEENFELTDPGGNKMISPTFEESVEGAFNDHSFSTPVKPGSSEILVLFYQVKDHGVYLFSFKSPISGSKVSIDLPAS